MGKYSIEWMYNECMNKHHALGITLKEPICVDGKKYFEATIIAFELPLELKNIVLNNILHGINTYVGKYPCIGFLVQFGVHPKQNFNVDIATIVEVNKINN